MKLTNSDASYLIKSHLPRAFFISGDPLPDKFWPFSSVSMWSHIVNRTAYFLLWHSDGNSFLNEKLTERQFPVSQCPGWSHLCRGGAGVGMLPAGGGAAHWLSACSCWRSVSVWSALQHAGQHSQCWGSAEKCKYSHCSLQAQPIQPGLDQIVSLKVV